MKSLLSNQHGHGPADAEATSVMANGSSASGGRGGARRSGGFTLMELMITVVIIAILAAIAWPIYSKYVTKTRRVAAEGCLSEYASYMERYYTTNLRYNKDTAGTPNTQLLAGLDCAGISQTGLFYAYAFPAAALSVSSYTVTATPINSQLTNDTICGMLSVDEKGARLPATAGCW